MKAPGGQKSFCSNSIAASPIRPDRLHGAAGECLSLVRPYGGTAQALSRPSARWQMPSRVRIGQEAKARNSFENLQPCTRRFDLQRRIAEREGYRSRPARI